jgi:hypothetical protein
LKIVINEKLKVIYVHGGKYQYSITGLEMVPKDHVLKPKKGGSGNVKSVIMTVVWFDSFIMLM